MITSTDIQVNNKFKIQTGTIFIIDSIKTVDGEITVSTSIEGGSKGNYKNDLQDCIDFLNEENAIKL